MVRRVSDACMKRRRSDTDATFWWVLLSGVAIGIAVSLIVAWGVYTLLVMFGG